LTCKKEFEHYKLRQPRKFCCKKCQYEFDYPGCYWIGNNGYLYYQKGRKNKQLVHRMILDVKKGQIVHHRDGNKLNNSKENLEILCGQSEHLKIHNPVKVRWEKYKTAHGK
jgi:hypothetical protein